MPKPSENPSGFALRIRLYFTKYPSSSHNTDTVSCVEISEVCPMFWTNMTDARTCWRAPPTCLTTAFPALKVLLVRASAMFSRSYFWAIHVIMSTLILADMIGQRPSWGVCPELQIGWFLLKKYLPNSLEAMAISGCTLYHDVSILWTISSPECIDWLMYRGFGRSVL